jgi:hypothetical protein
VEDGIHRVRGFGPRHIVHFSIGEIDGPNQRDASLLSRNEPLHDIRSAKAASFLQKDENPRSRNTRMELVHSDADKRMIPARAPVTHGSAIRMSIEGVRRVNASSPTHEAVTRCSWYAAAPGL